jgi:flagellar basal body-associated protein FliL
MVQQAPAPAKKSNNSKVVIIVVVVVLLLCCVCILSVGGWACGDLLTGAAKTCKLF